MSWRTVVVSNTAKLDYQMGFLVVRGKETKKIHLNEIAILIVESTAVSLTAYLLSELSKHKIKVIFCDEKRYPSSELVSYYGSHDTSAKVRQQIIWNADTKEAVWTEIVTQKINNQAKMLELYDKEEATLLREYVREIQFGDATNREGHAAKVYFNALFGKGFTRTEECPINAALNYGYTLLVSSFSREVTSNGYLTQLGLFHDNMFNQFNLASDLMEPFRTLVDELVIELQPEKFEVEEKRAMLELFRLEVEIGGRKENVLNAIKIYTKSVFDAINNSDISEIKFYKV